MASPAREAPWSWTCARYSRPDISYVPVPDLAPDQVCLAVAASRTSPVLDDFVAAARATAGTTAEYGNYETVPEKR
ncbi:hypothetical protein [Actinomycetospora sp. TBRC 11914]|uniref:hypothetical protein n=1 Tax=Actinomycetospora sp. TBRC 11914 TaxID=2729387 RepID=UPI0020070BB0|nr:hypothetical protein [Actinomycetospora sp. TBRC 11914]